MKSRTGITGVVRSTHPLRYSPHARSGERLCYNLGLPFQVGPREAMLAAGTRLVNAGIIDYAAGVDVIPFDDVSAISADWAIPICRNHEEINPLNGVPSAIMKFPMVGGFVPLGARKADGGPHPHAGTGFGLVYAHSCTLGDVEERDDQAKPARLRWVHGNHVYRYLELFQFAYDGTAFSTVRSDRFHFEELLPGYVLPNRPLSSAIPDGDDLLHPMVGGTGDPDGNRNQPGCGSGVMRWTYGRDGWRPVYFVAVTEGMKTFEPSMVRDTDGALLFSARPVFREAAIRNDIIVWRSNDNGVTWEKILHRPQLRSACPVTINKAADGTVFIAGNLYAAPPFVAPREKLQDGSHREILCLWPLNEERTDLESPLFARIPRFEWGPSPHGTGVIADHPMTGVVRLADGNWHTLMGVRVMDGAESCFGTDTSDFSGCYVDEVLTAGEPVPTWNFV